MKRLAICALLGLGCVPELVWTRTTLETGHRYSVVRVDGVEELRRDGVALGRADRFDVSSVGWAAGRLVMRVQQAGREALLGARPMRFGRRVGSLRVVSGQLAYTLESERGWHLVDPHGMSIAMPSIDSDSLVFDGARAALVARSGDTACIVMTNAPCVPSGAIRQLDLRAGVLSWVVSDDTGDGLVVGGREVMRARRIVEVAVHAPHWAALIEGPDGRMRLVRDGVDDAEVEVEAAHLRELRLSSAGVTACLRPSTSGTSIAVLRAGRVLSQHVRVDGASLAFVPGTDRVVLTTGDSRGLRVEGAMPDGVVARGIVERVLSEGHVGVVGEDERGAIVWIDGREVARHAWAGQLRLEGRAYAYTARDADGERSVQTRGGTWPIPRAFVDTLELHPDGHFGIVVPEPTRRRFEVWIDGAPFAALDTDDIASIVAERGVRALPPEALRVLVRRVLDQRSRAAAARD